METRPIEPMPSAAPEPLGHMAPVGEKPFESRDRRLWQVLWVVSIAQAVAWGTLFYSFGIMMQPMERDLGFSRAEATGAFSLALLISGAAALPVGLFLDRRGPRVLMPVCALASAILLLAWSQVQSLMGLYFVWILIGLAMAGSLYEPAFFIVATWFQRGQSRAFAILTVIGGLASVVFVPLGALLIHRIGWRETLVVFAVALFLFGFLSLAVALRMIVPAQDSQRSAPSPKAPDRAVSDGVRNHVMMVLSERRFWQFTVAFSLSTFTTVAVSVHMVPLLVEQGCSTSAAAACLGGVGLMSIPGRALLAPLGAALPREVVAAGIFGLLACSYALLQVLPMPTRTWVFAAVFGVAFGAVTPARAAMLADHYGSSRYGSISSFVVVSLTLARAGAPWIVSVWRDAAGGYGPVLLGLAVIAGLAALMILKLRAGDASSLDRLRSGGELNG